MNLLDTIAKGENKNMEFKVELPSSISLAKTAIAFANTGGGKIVIGVNNEGELIGLKPEVDVFELQDQVASIIHENCYPNIVPDIYTAAASDVVLLVIEIYRGSLLPYYLKKKGKNNGVYIRVGATNRPASIDNIIDLERQRVNLGYDQEINREISLSDLDVSPLEKKFAAIGHDFDQNAMLNFKLIREESSNLYPTNGLLILLGQLPHVRIKCSRFKGLNMDIFLDRKEYEGDLFAQLEQAENFIKNYISLKSEIKGLQRVDQYEVPDEAIRESIINAVVHRDYTNPGRDIKIGIYDDIINIVSPGGLPGTLTEDDMLQGRSEIRNRTIARVFKELGFIEQWGSGVRRVISSCQTAGLRTPEFREKGDFVDVCLYREQLNKSLNSHSDYLVFNEQEDQILTFMYTNNNRVTTADAQKILSLGERRAREILRGMVQEGKLERVGYTTNSYYRLIIDNR